MTVCWGSTRTHATGISDAASTMSRSTLPSRRRSRHAAAAASRHARAGVGIGHGLRKNLFDRDGGETAHAEGNECGKGQRPNVTAGHERMVAPEGNNQGHQPGGGDRQLAGEHLEEHDEGHPMQHRALIRPVVIGRIDDRGDRLRHPRRVRVGDHLQHVAVVVLEESTPAVEQEVIVESEISRRERGADTVPDPRGVVVGDHEQQEEQPVQDDDHEGGAGDDSKRGQVRLSSAKRYLLSRSGIIVRQAQR